MAKILGMNNGGGNTPPPTQPKIDITKSKAMLCDNCGYDVFIPGTKFRTISKIVAGTPQDVVIPIEVYLCGECGEIHKAFLPKELQDLDK